MKASEIAEGALHLLKEKGWIQRAQSSDRGFCVVGALFKAATGASDWRDNDGPYQTALKELGLLTMPKPTPVAWNDAPERTFEDVENVLFRLTASLQFGEAMALVCERVEEVYWSPRIRVHLRSHCECICDHTGPISDWSFDPYCLVHGVSI